MTEPIIDQNKKVVSFKSSPQYENISASEWFDSDGWTLFIYCFAIIGFVGTVILIKTCKRQK